jgi:hypothetical protein
VKETPVGFGLGPSVSPEIALTIAAENPADGREAASDLLGAERWTAERNVRDPRNKVIYAGLTDERLRAAEREYRRRGPM